MRIANLKKQMRDATSWACNQSPAALVAGILVVMTGCSSTQDHAASYTSRNHGNTLLVGVAPDYPPLVFEEGDSLIGAEVDLGHALGKELNRPVQFVTLQRDDLINALIDGRADIIMSGLSVTKGRQLRAVFSHPYLTNQIRAIFRQGDADRFHTADDVRATTARIGVQPGTTADLFVQRNCPDAQRIPLRSRQDVFFSLTDGGKIDLYIDDSFALAQMVSEHEAALAHLQEPLAVEELAWAISPANDELLRQVNEILERWKSDGTLALVFQHWMPYLKKP